MYLFCYKTNPTKSKYLKSYLLNLKNNQFFDLKTNKKVVLEDTEKAELSIAKSYTFYQDSTLVKLFETKGFYAICDHLDNKNYTNSPLLVLGYSIKSAFLHDEILLNSVNTNTLSISYHIQSLDERINQNIDYFDLKFKNSI